MTWDGSRSLMSDGSRALLDDGSADTCGQCPCGNGSSSLCPACPAGKTPTSLALTIAGMGFNTGSGPLGLQQTGDYYHVSFPCGLILGNWTTLPAALNGSYTLPQVAGSPCVFQLDLTATGAGSSFSRQIGMSDYAYDSPRSTFAVTAAHVQVTIGYSGYLVAAWYDLTNVAVPGRWGPPDPGLTVGSLALAVGPLYPSNYPIGTVCGAGGTLTWNPPGACCYPCSFDPPSLFTGPITFTVGNPLP